MKYPRYLALFIILFSLSLLTNARTTTWTLYQDSAGIRIYQQATSSGYAITRGTMEMQTSLKTLLAIMKDRSTCQQWLFSCKEGYLVKQYNLQQRLDYTVIDSPLWFADRDMYTFSSSHIDHQNKTVIIKLSGRENHDKGQEKRVRLKNLQGLWNLQQYTPNKVRVLYQIYANPQLMPSPLLDAYVAHSVFQTLKNLETVSLKWDK